MLYYRIFLIICKQTCCPADHNRCPAFGVTQEFYCGASHAEIRAEAVQCVPRTRSVLCGLSDDIIRWLGDPKLCNPPLLYHINCGLVYAPLCDVHCWLTEARTIHASLSRSWELHCNAGNRPNTYFQSENKENSKKQDLARVQAVGLVTSGNTLSKLAFKVFIIRSC